VVKTLLYHAAQDFIHTTFDVHLAYVSVLALVFRCIGRTPAMAFKHVLSAVLILSCIAAPALSASSQALGNRRLLQGYPAIALAEKAALLKLKAALNNHVAFNGYSFNTTNGPVGVNPWAESTPATPIPQQYWPCAGAAWAWIECYNGRVVGM
jgi:hypothetical protein